MTMKHNEEISYCIVRVNGDQWLFNESIKKHENY